VIATPQKALLLFISQPYLTDYFDQVREALSSLCELRIDVLAPFDAGRSDIRPCAADALCYERADYFWSTAEMLHLAPPDSLRIASYHHAGYGEHQFILNRNALAHADILFCATFRPEGALREADAYRGLAFRPTRRLAVVPIGYPKLDRTISVVQQSCPGQAVIIALSTVSDNPYCIKDALREVLVALLEMGVPVILRPFPPDVTHNPVIGQVIQEFAVHPLFSLSEGSYLSAFAKARSMIFFGRPDATTAYTFSFSTLRPCFFYFPDSEPEGAERDIGMTASNGLQLAQLACTTDTAGWQRRLFEARTEALDYVGESDVRLHQVFRSLACNELIENSTYYDLDLPLGSIAYTCEQLIYLDREVRCGPGTTETSYIQVDHLMGLVSRVVPDTLAQDAAALVHFISSVLADAPLQNQRRALQAVVPLFNIEPNLPCWRELNDMVQRTLSIR
jgi:hypothetical protein